VLAPPALVLLCCPPASKTCAIVAAAAAAAADAAVAVVGARRGLNAILPKNGEATLIHGGKTLLHQLFDEDVYTSVLEGCGKSARESVLKDLLKVEKENEEARAAQAVIITEEMMSATKRRRFLKAPPILSAIGDQDPKTPERALSKPKTP